MNCSAEAKRIATNFAEFAKRNPRASHNMKCEVRRMMDFLFWVSETIPNVYVRNGGHLFRIYAMQKGGWN